jgi:hypothetical protein
MWSASLRMSGLSQSQPVKNHKTSNHAIARPHHAEPSQFFGITNHLTTCKNEQERHDDWNENSPVHSKWNPVWKSDCKKTP